MPYQVVALSLVQVRQGALSFLRRLSPLLRERPEIKVYAVSPFDLEERRRMKERFGGDVVYFFNEAAWQECRQIGLELDSAGEIPDADLPPRRTLVVGRPSP